MLLPLLKRLTAVQPTPTAKLPQPLGPYSHRQPLISLHLESGLEKNPLSLIPRLQTLATRLSLVVRPKKKCVQPPSPIMTWLIIIRTTRTMLETELVALGKHIGRYVCYTVVIFHALVELHTRQESQDESIPNYQ